MAALLELLDWHLASKCVLSTEAMKDLLDLIGRHVALRKPPGTASYVTACLGSLQCCMQLILNACETQERGVGCGCAVLTPLWVLRHHARQSRCPTRVVALRGKKASYRA
jgi:hypothetical protein